MWRCVGLAALAATMPVQALAGPISYACSAPLTQAGNVQEDQAGPTYRVRGTLRLSEIERVPDPALAGTTESASSAPGATVAVRGDRNSIHLYISPRYAPGGVARIADLYVRALMPGGGPDRPLGTISYGEGPGWEDLAFDIEVQAARVIVTAGGRREEIAMTIGPDATIELGCVGGLFQFQDVDWGQPR